MTIRPPSIGLWSGVAVFLSLKGLFLLAFTFASGAPRLGDDALIYLWQGRILGSRSVAASPAVRDIRDLSHLDEGAPSKLMIPRVALHMQTTGSGMPFSIHAWLIRGLLATGLPAKWVFFATEAVIAALLAVGIGALVKVLFGGEAAGWALMILSVAILPQHGLQQLVPSVMALALALILWSCILADAGGWPGTFLLALALAGIHPIAQPYLLAALALAAAASLAECGFSLRRLRIIGLIALALVASFLVQRPHLPHFLPKGMISEIYGSAGFGSISVNLPGAGQALLEAARDNRLTVGLGLGGVIFFGRGLLSTWRVCSVLLVCAAMLAGSLLHHAPGLEGVLFVRMLVPCGILAAGWAGLFCARVISRSPVWMGWVLLGLFLTFPVYKGARRYEAYMYTQLNKFSVIDSRALRRQIEDVPEGASVLYLDHPTLMMACLLEGAWRLPAVPWAMIKGSGLMSSVLRDRRPDLIVAYPYRWLNSLALIGRNELIQRRHGFYMKDFSGIAVEGPALKGRPAAILVDNPGSDFVLAVSAPAGCAALRVPAVFSGWVSIPPACSVKGRVSFDLPDRRAWILGVSVDAPRNHVRWPWGPERTVVTARFRSPFGMRSVEPGWEVSPESLSFDFSWGSLFSYDGAADALPLLRRPFEILGDDSGLVFIRTARPAGKG